MKKISKILSIVLALFMVSSVGSIFKMNALTGAMQDQSSTTNPATNNYTYSGQHGSFQNLKVPTIVSKGSGCSIGGKFITVSTNYEIGVGVCGINLYSDSISTKKTNSQNYYRYASDISSKQYSTGYELSRLDPYIYFNQLPAGKYCYYIYSVEHNSTTTTQKELYKCQFIVQNTYSAKAYQMNNIAFSDYSLPDTINRGSYFSLKGDLRILYPITAYDTNKPTKMTGYIYSDGYSGLNYAYKGDFNLYFSNSIRTIAYPSEIDNKMLFNMLGAYRETRSYAYVMSLRINNSERFMIVKNFKVK